MSFFGQFKAELLRLKNLLVSRPHPLPRLRPLKFHSIMFEMSVIYSLILALILLVFSGVIYIILAQTLYAELDNEVRSKAEEIAGSIRTYVETRGDDPEALTFALEKTIANEDKVLRRWWYTGFERSWFERLDQQDLSNEYINFVSPEGKAVMHSQNLTPPLQDLFLGNLNTEPKGFLFNVGHDDLKLRVVNYPFKTNGGPNYVLQVGVSPKPVILWIQNWMNLIFLSIPIFVVLTSFIGRILVSRMLKPVEKISNIANTISEEDLSKRVVKENFYEEMDSLVDAFNGMIERLERSFNHIQNFSTHMAHELKTPLTIMRGEAELALMAKRTPQEYQKALKITLGEIASMLKIIEDLLFLTKTDHQPGIFNLEEVNFTNYFSEIYEQAKLLAAPKGIQVNLNLASKEPILVKADPLHLRRAFLNLLDNAIKFSNEQGRVDLNVDPGEDSLAVSVRDYGQGIPLQEQKKIFQRFYTLDHHHTGSGLGLSIAQSIVKAHDGRIEVSSEEHKGSTFTVILPLLHASFSSI